MVDVATKNKSLIQFIGYKLLISVFVVAIASVVVVVVTVAFAGAVYKDVSVWFSVFFKFRHVKGAVIMT